ncbi:MAG: hypothetical protein JXR48_13990, partial [Candidatus Delongbacteria bacterium]|nr:hypothetical protein [Candidatus Delongbacteria bacterium]
ESIINYDDCFCLKQQSGQTHFSSHYKIYTCSIPNSGFHTYILRLNLLEKTENQIAVGINL